MAKKKQQNGKGKTLTSTERRGPRAAKSASANQNAAVGFIVDTGLQVREFIGHTAPLLAIAPGNASLDVRRIVREDLSAGLVRAVQMAKTKKRPVQLAGPEVRISGVLQKLHFKVVPSGAHGSQPERWKIFVHYSRPSLRPAREQPHPSGSERESIGNRIRRLREEFRTLLEEEERQHSALLSELEASVTTVEDSQAELETANAELEASNAELRATLEERDEIERKLRQSEAASREMLETAAQGVIVVDTQERIVRANELACTMFGYSREELIGKKLGALIPTGVRKAHAGHTAGFFAQPERRPMGAGRDLSARRKDGSQFPVEIGLSSVVFDDGRLAVAFISDITQRKRTEQEIIDSRERLRQLSNRLITAAEDETRKWARELHDVYSQRLVSIAMGLEKSAAGQPGDSPLRAIETQVRSLAEDVHRMSRRMHPSVLHDLGLVAALKSELAAFQKEHGIQVDFRTDNVSANLPKDVALCLYRVTQEALTNIRKHSRAERVRVDVAGVENALVMAIRDEGSGFDLELMAHRGGLGLMSMEERVQAIGGEFSVESSSGKGTTVRVRVPLGSG